MSSSHLSLDQLQGYNYHTLPDHELRQVFTHLIACQECLNKVRSYGSLAALLDKKTKACEYLISHGWPENVDELVYEDPEHLNFQERSSYVRGELEEAHRILVRSHIEDCSTCAEEVQDLQAFAAEVDFCCLPLSPQIGTRSDSGDF